MTRTPLFVLLLVVLAFVSVTSANSEFESESLSFDLAELENDDIDGSFMEEASSATPNTTRSTVTIAKLTNNVQTYGHGAVMGAALEFANDARWSEILTQVQPVDAAETLRLKGIIYAANNDDDRSKATGKLILYLENNPVLAAYAALQHIKECTGSESSEPAACDSPLRAEWDLWTAPSDPSSIALAKIAHGTQMTLITQNLLKSSNIGFNRADVVAAPTAVQWLEFFGRSINLALSNKDIAGPPGATLASTYLKAPSGLVLDVKSTYSSPTEIDSFVTALKTQYGINVFGVGSFVRSQIDTLKTTTPVFFYHTHYALLKEAASGNVKKGDYVMFNGASLLVEGGTPAAPTYSLNAAEFQALSKVQTDLNLRIALYAQEPALSPAAANAIVEYCNENSATITDGFAYGHLNGRADSFIKGNGLGGQAPLLTVEKTAFAVSKPIQAVGKFFKKLFSKSEPVPAPAAAAAAPVTAPVAVAPAVGSLQPVAAGATPTKPRFLQKRLRLD